MTDPESGVRCGTYTVDAIQRDAYAASLVRARWPAHGSIGAFSTLRGPAGYSVPPFGPLNLGVRGGDDVTNVIRSRDALPCWTDVPSAPHWLHQVHGTRVVECDHVLPPQAFPRDPAAVRRDWRDDEPEADAAVTRTPGVVLAILTADCLPVLFCADDGSEVGAAHAGWRGLSVGVLEATLAAMRAPRENILAWLGPAIAAQSYEVGGEVRDAFVAHDPAASSAFSATREGHWLCDLYELARQRLRAAGVSRIFGGGFDTFTDPRLHSYRRDGANSGRMANLVWVAP